MFGIACGITGSPQMSMMKTASYVNNLKRNELLAWTRSDNVQDNIHGFVGLYFMKRNGTALSEEEVQAMKKVKASADVVEYCQGCAFGMQEKMNQLLSNKSLRNYYNWYLYSGYKNYK